MDTTRRSLHLETLDAFFAEYISLKDNPDAIQKMLALLQRWKPNEVIRYVGVTTHNHDIAMQLIAQGWVGCADVTLQYGSS